MKIPTFHDKPWPVRGINLGSWLNIEDFMIGLPGVDWQMRAEAARQWGAAEAGAFFDAWETHFLSEADIAWIAARGFNTVRLPFHYLHLETDAAPGVFTGRAWDAIARCLGWCETHGLAVMLDLHGAPGGQNTTSPAGNATGYARLWQDQTCQDRTVALWTELLRRFHRSPALFSCNLFNEPMVNNHGPQTHPEQAAAMNALYARLIDAIRAIDSKVWIAIDGPVRSSGGVRWLDPALFADERTIFCYHHYPLEAYEGSVNYEQNQSRRGDGEADDMNFLREELREELEFAARIDRPVVLGEFGLPADWDPVLGARTLKAQLKIHEELGWGWLLWSYKDVNTIGLLNPAPDRPWRQWIEDPARIARHARVREGFQRYYDEIVIPELPKSPENSRTHDAAFDDAQRGLTRVLLDRGIHDLAQVPAAARHAMMEDFALHHCTVREDIWSELAPWLGK